MKILIAEDDPMIQWVHHSMMSQWGYDYDMADNGYAALELARNNAGCYDLALMDVEMPVMDGIEATRNIRREVGYFPIVAYSSDESYRKQCLDAGMDIFLKKPCLPDRLHAYLKRLALKLLSCRHSKGQIALELIKPMDKEELNELIELDRQGLTKLSLIGTDYKFVVHKNLQNKLSHDFIGEEKGLSEFLDRNPESPGIIHVYAHNLYATKRYITTTLLSQLMETEDSVMEKFTEIEEFPKPKDK
ncbi:response regulator [Sedimenticola sp.]|uniref:response regulator n=1 Tax=Sedimenticola sp. TaxID=1940285 RepID=UPI003D0A9B0E